jgi:ABC-type glutathione transport system ATPase component
MKTLELTNASVTYHQRGKKVNAVRGIDLTLHEGETVALVGESGSGKSSTARVVAGLQKLSGGTIAWTGDGSAARVQMVFQHPDQSLDPSWTVKRSIAEPLRRQGVRDRAEIDRRCAKVLERVHLGDEYLRRHPRELSGGQAQRVAIARALVPSPSFVVLDEPTASLDQTVRSRLLSTLSELQQETGVGYLLVSHDMSSVRRISDRIYVMYLGQIVERGSMSQIMDTPVHPYTRALIEAVPPADPRTEWHPTAFSVDAAIAAGRDVGEVPCPLGSCSDHGPGFFEVAPGHSVVCTRSTSAADS